MTATPAGDYPPLLPIHDQACPAARDEGFAAAAPRFANRFPADAVAALADELAGGLAVMAEIFGRAEVRPAELSTLADTALPGNRGRLLHQFATFSRHLFFDGQLAQRLARRGGPVRLPGRASGPVAASYAALALSLLIDAVEQLRGGVATPDWLARMRWLAGDDVPNQLGELAALAQCEAAEAAARMRQPIAPTATPPAEAPPGEGDTPAGDQANPPEGVNRSNREEPSGAGASTNPTDAMATQETDLLRAMWLVGATGERRRGRLAQYVGKIDPEANLETYKPYLARLGRRGLVSAKRGSGSWLTERGVAFCIGQGWRRGK